MMFDHCITPLVQGNRVIMAVYDRWNSVDHVQRLRRDFKVEALQYVLKWADFARQRSLLRVIIQSIRIYAATMSVLNGGFVMHSKRLVK